MRWINNIIIGGDQRDLVRSHRRYIGKIFCVRPKVFRKLNLQSTPLKSGQGLWQVRVVGSRIAPKNEPTWSNRPSGDRFDSQISLLQANSMCRQADNCAARRDNAATGNHVGKLQSPELAGALELCKQLFHSMFLGIISAIPANHFLLARRGSAGAAELEPSLHEFSARSLPHPRQAL